LDSQSQPSSSHLARLTFIALYPFLPRVTLLSALFFLSHSPDNFLRNGWHTESSGVSGVDPQREAVAAVARTTKQKKGAASFILLFATLRNRLRRPSKPSSSCCQAGTLARLRRPSKPSSSCCQAGTLAYTSLTILTGVPLPFLPRLSSHDGNMVTPCLPLLTAGGTLDMNTLDKLCKNV